MNMLQQPQFSVIMPCYNQGAYVAQAIHSIQAQTNEEWELIVVNDGSTDSSDEIISGIAALDKRIHYVCQDNAGVSAARNFGVQLAQGKYVLFCDADDWLAPECLERANTAFAESPNCTLFYLKNVVVNEDGKELVVRGFCGSYKLVLLYGLDMKYVIRRTHFLDIGGLDESMRSGCEDWEFGIRFLNKYPIVLESTDILYYYRKYDNSQRLTKIAGKNLTPIHSYIYRKNIDIFVQQIGSPIEMHRWVFGHQWSDRKLPQYVKKLLDIKAYLFHLLKK